MRQVCVTLVRHAEPAPPGATAAAAHLGAGNDALGRQYAMLGSALSPAQFAVIYTPDDAAAGNTTMAISQMQHGDAKPTVVRTDLLQERALRAGDTDYDASEEWSNVVAHMAPPSGFEGHGESLGEIRRRAAQAVESLVLPYVAPMMDARKTSICLVAGALMVNELLHAMLQLNKPHDIPMHTAPLPHASFHQLELSAAPDRVPSARILTLSEVAHLREVTQLLPSVSAFPLQTPSPQPPRSATETPPAIGTPNAPPGWSGRAALRIAALRSGSSSPHTSRGVHPSSASSPSRGRLADTASILSGLPAWVQQSVTSGGGRGNAQLARSAHLYDVSAMVKSIDKWDPVPVRMEPDGNEMPEPPSTPFALAARTGEALSPAVGSIASARASSSSLATGSGPVASGVVSPPLGSSRLPSGGAAGVAPAVATSSLPGTSTLHLQSPLSNMSAFAQNLFGSHTPAAPGTAPSSEETATQGTLLWHKICVSLFPLFNEEPLASPVEELGQVMERYVQVIFELHPERALALLEEDFRRLAYTGMLSIIQKLQGREGFALLARLAEEWSFFFGTVVPYVQACALPLQTRAAHLLRMQDALAQRQQAPAPKRAPRTARWVGEWSPDDASDSLSDASESVRSTSDADDSSSEDTVPAASNALPSEAGSRSVDTRRILLLAFRDQLILPIGEWLVPALVQLDEFLRTAGTMVPPSSELDSLRMPLPDLRARLFQLVHVLKGLQTKDAAQQTMARLCATLPFPDAPLRASLFSKGGEDVHRLDTGPMLSNSDALRSGRVLSGGVRAISPPESLDGRGSPSAWSMLSFSTLAADSSRRRVHTAT